MNKYQEALDNIADELIECGRKKDLNGETILKEQTELNLLQELVDKSTTKWIPVEERLPSPDEHVLVTWKEYLTGDCWIDILRLSEHGDWVCVLGTLAGNVIAWMPLPEAYGGKR